MGARAQLCVTKPPPACGLLLLLPQETLLGCVRRMVSARMRVRLPLPGVASPRISWHVGGLFRGSDMMAMVNPAHLQGLNSAEGEVCATPHQQPPQVRLSPQQSAAIVVR